MKAFRAAAGLVVMAMLVFLTVRAGAAAPTTQHAATRHVKSTQVGFDGCPKATTVLSASIARLSFTQHQTVTVDVTLTNNASGSCGQPVSTPPVPGGQQLTIGPCGDLSLVVRNSSGQNVYPGNVAFHCPAIFGISIPAHTSVSTTGSWNQSASYDSKKLAPRGSYQVNVAGKLTFTITLTGSSNGPLPALAEPQPLLPPSTLCSGIGTTKPHCVPVRIPNAVPPHLHPTSPCLRQYVLIAAPATPTPLCSTTVPPRSSGQ